MAERLAGGNVALALLAYAIATGANLIALILMFATISGAHSRAIGNLPTKSTSMQYSFTNWIHGAGSAARLTKAISKHALIEKFSGKLHLTILPAYRWPRDSHLPGAGY